MSLILHGLPAWHWSLSGALIAVVTLTLLLVGNRRLGISSGFEDVCSLVLRQPYFRRGRVLDGRRWRLPFLAGLVLGGVLSAVLGGGWSASWSVGMLDAALPLSPAAKLLWMFVGGLFVGFGTRMANGCTSGHGIFGLSNFEWPSLVATLCFMGSGLVVTQLLYNVVLR
ncbi:MAG: YeeE/YedE family protein [Vicinamibacterales bacterium]